QLGAAREKLGSGLICFALFDPLCVFARNAPNCAMVHAKSQSRFPKHAKKLQNEVTTKNCVTRSARRLRARWRVCAVETPRAPSKEGCAIMRTTSEKQTHDP